MNMTPSDTIVAAPTHQRASAAGAAFARVSKAFIVSGLWLPSVFIMLMTVAVAFTTADPPGTLVKSPLAVAGHHLGHELNSIWVGIGLLLMVIPGLRARARGESGEWAWRCLDAIVCDFLVVDTIGRRFVPAGRPYHPELAGWPSGHTTFAFVMAWMIWRCYPKLGPLWFACAATIGWSRIQVNAHFPDQVIAGAFLGCAIGALVVGRKSGVFLPRILLSDKTLMMRITGAKSSV